MAGDWIKVEKATARKPEVLRIADSLQVPIDHAFGLCVRFWMWCDDQMADGHALSVTAVTLDAVFGHAGFVTALISVGWLRVREGSLEVPNFDRHLSDSAKNRALSGRRQQKRRSEHVTKTSRSKRDESVTREEKRRVIEKDNTPLPPKGGGDVNPKGFDPLAVEIPEPLRTPEFLAAWGEWVAYRKDKKKPISQRASAAQLTDLARHGPSGAAAAIRQSIRNDWQGLFDPKEDAHGNHANSARAISRSDEGPRIRDDAILDQLDRELKRSQSPAGSPAGES